MNPPPQGSDWAKVLNISAGSQQKCTKPSEQDLFFWASQNESKKSYAMIKIEQKVKYFSGFSTKMHHTFRTSFIFPSQ